MNGAATPSPPVQPRDLPILRAAYSDRTAALMASLAGYAYEFPPQDWEPGPSPVPPQLSALGFERINYFHNGLIDGWAYIAEGKDLIVIAFRGTKSATNWRTNFQVEMVHPEGADANLRVHKGFYQAFELLNDGTKGLKTAVAALKTVNHATPIYLTGHSLGGALAQIATAVFGSDQIAACYTFGSPRVGNAYFDLWVKPPSYRVENYADIVPQIPVFAPQAPWPAFYRHSGDPRYLPDKVSGSPYRYEPSLPVRALQLAKGVLQFAQAGNILGIEDHNIALYTSKLAQIVSARDHSR